MTNNSSYPPDIVNHIESWAASNPPRSIQSDDRVVVESDHPMRLAESLVDNNFTHPSTPLIRRWREQFWTYRNDTWQAQSDEVIDSEIRSFLDHVALRSVSANGTETIKPLRVTNRAVVEVRNALIRQPRLDPTYGTTVESTLNPPIWLDGRPNARHGVVTFRNGSVDVDTFLANGDVVVTPPTPLLFAANVIPHTLNPHAPEPATWISFLNALWPDDPDAVRLLQQWFGYVLSGRTHIHKCLLLVGVSRSGKSTIINTISHMLGDANVEALTFASFSSDFGLSSLLGKMLATVPDARLSGRTDQSVIAERVLSITGGDALPIYRKYLPNITARLGCRLMMSSNELPRLTDASNALSNRFLILTTKQSYLGREDTTLGDRIIAETPGIIRWSLEGLQSLAANGWRFTEPAGVAEIRQELDDIASPVGQFIRECCRTGPDEEVEVKLAFAAWRRWCTENNHHATSLATFARDLRTRLPELAVTQKRVDDDRVRFYVGLGLTLSASHMASMEANR